MFKSVLLTLDLTNEASWRKALPQAVEIASASGGVLHVLSVVPTPGSPLVAAYFPEGFEEKALEKARDEMDALVRSRVPEGIEVHQHLAYGTIHEEVLEAIDKIGCDLVVMSSHKPDRVREFLVGSNADRIVRRSPVSVLVVRG